MIHEFTRAVLHPVEVVHNVTGRQVTCLGRHFEAVEADATGAVNVGMIDRCYKLNVRWLKRVPEIQSFVHHHIIKQFVFVISSVRPKRYALL